MSAEWAATIELLQRVAVALESNVAWVWHLVAPVAIVLNGVIGIWAGFRVSERTRKRDQEKENQTNLKKQGKILDLLNKEINERWMESIYRTYKPLLDCDPFDVDEKENVFMVQKFCSSRIRTHDLFVIEAVGHNFIDHHYIDDEILYSIVDVHGKIHDLVDEKDITDQYFSGVVAPSIRTLEEEGMNKTEISENLRERYSGMKKNWAHHKEIVSSINESFSRLRSRCEVSS